MTTDHETASDELIRAVSRATGILVPPRVEGQSSADWLRAYEAPVMAHYEAVRRRWIP